MPKFKIGDTVQVNPVNLPPGWEPWANQVGVITYDQGPTEGPLGYEEVYTVHNDVVGDMTLYEGDLILVTPTATTTTSATTSKWSPMPFSKGPPLPQVWGVYWPWVKS